jgi:acyl-coenzyme A thioesterase PaaI-like protein
LARAIEGLIEDPAVVVARLTVDLFRPVPSEPLAVEARVLRPGKRLQMAEATLLAAGVEVARAAAQLLRTIH